MITLIRNPSPVGERVVNIPLAALTSRGEDCRLDFNDGALLSLADSINRHGILTPLTVRRSGAGYEVISGERRLRAAIILRMRELPCFVIENGDIIGAELALVENGQRESLNMFEQAQMIASLLKDNRLTREEVAARLSCSRSSISNKLRLLRYDPEERRLILTGGLTERHARALLRISGKSERLAALRRVIDEDMNVCACEEMVEELLSPSTEQIPAVSTATPPQPPHVISCGCACAIRDPDFFFNTFESTVSKLRRAGLTVNTYRSESPDCISFTVTLDKR